MKVVIVTGSVCSGKTTIAKAIAEKLNAKYVDVNKLIKEKKLSEGYDKKRETEIVDTNKLNKELIKLIRESKGDLVIDSHLSHFLDKRYVDLCIVTKCELRELERRLKARGYNKGKVKENKDVEIFDVCYTEAMDNGHKIEIVDTSLGFDVDKVVKRIKERI